MFAYPPPGSYLLPGERRVLRCRRHWAILAPQTMLTIVVVVMFMVLARWLSGHGAAFVVTVLWYAAAAMVFRLAVLIADWWDDVIMLTDGRVINVTGLLASRGRDTPIKKITDRDLQHTVIGNILGYATFTFESAGPASLQRLTYVPNPMTVYEAILKLTSDEGLPPPAAGKELTTAQPSVEDESREWPVDGDGE